MRLAAWVLTLLACPTGALAQAAAGAPESGSVPTSDAVPMGLAEVHRAGDAGPTVVLIPGLGFGWDVFDAFIEANADRYTIIAVTLGGFDAGADANRVRPTGAAADPTPWLDAAEAALRRLIAEDGGGRAVVIGHSLGGHLALRLAGAEGVAGVVSLDGRPVYEAPGLPTGTTRERRSRQVWGVHAESIRRIPDRTWSRTLARATTEGLDNPGRGRALAAELRRRDPGVLKQAYLELLASDARPILAAVRTPTLIIAGAVEGGPEREAAVVALWRELTDAAAGPVEIEFVPGARHWPLDNAAERTRRRLDVFITEVTQQ